MFADDLARVLRASGRAVIRVSVDHFHQPTAIRYRRGGGSPEGFWRDCFDYERLSADVLVPLGPGGSRRYRPIAYDLRADEMVDCEPRVAPSGALLVLDGLFCIATSSSARGTSRCSSTFPSPRLSVA